MNSTFYGLNYLVLGYNYRKKILIDHTKVGTANVSNFPFLFSGTYSYLKTTANSGNVTSSSGYDIIFTSDPQGLTKLDFEIESYSATTGKYIAWIRIPTMSFTADTAIYIWYGNAAVTTSQENKTGVWDSNYKAVYHLPDGTTLSANDSTSNANTGSITAATATAGQIDGAGSFNGSTALINCGTGASIANVWANGGTISVWTQNTNFGGSNNGRIVNKTGSTDTGSTTGWCFQVAFGATGSMKLTVAFGTTPMSYTSAAGSIAVGTKYHMVATYDGSSLANIPIFYINGATSTAVNQTTPVGTIVNDTTQSMLIGNIGNASRGFNGWIDEVRISNVVRSSSWVTSSYNNQNSPSTFYSIV